MLSDEEKEALEILNNTEWDGFMITIKNLIKKQSKEIEELKDMNERQRYRIELVSEDEIEERGDSIDESTMLKQIKNKLDEKNIPIETLLAEFERLEDLEDRKVQIEYINVFNKGVKSVEDKIKAKIEEVEQWELYNMKIPKLSTLDERLGAKIGIKYVLQSLLEKE